MKQLLLSAMTFGAGAMLLSGCLSAHPGTWVLHDNELTLTDFDDTVSYSTAGNVIVVPPPVPVHEFDEDVATAKGAEKVIDGPRWLNSDGEERNTLVNEAAANAPAGTIFVLVVASGELWKIPPGSGDLISSGVIDEWTNDEYWNLNRYFVPLPPPTTVTKVEFERITDIGPIPGIDMPYVIHDVGPVGQEEIKAAHGVEIVMPENWTQVPPPERALKLQSFDQFLRLLPAFKGQENQPAFGIAIPSGTVYAIPERGYDNLVAWGSLRPWTNEQIGMLPDVKSGSDRPIRSGPSVPSAAIDLDFKF